MCAPLQLRWGGNLAPSSAGGATTMDTTLPIITRYAGQQFVVVSIFHGFVTGSSQTLVLFAITKYIIQSVVFSKKKELLRLRTALLIL